MISGYLKVGIESISVESYQSNFNSALQTLICPACGFIELWAGSPKNLGQHHRTDKELKNILGN